MFAFSLDEYENLDTTQQLVVNTLVKHAGRSFTFKLGVKQGGFRTTETLAPEQRLQTPADYALSTSRNTCFETAAFPDFAERCIKARPSAISAVGGTRLDDVTLLFESLTSEEENYALGARPIADRVRSELLDAVDEAAQGDVRISRISSST